MKHFSFLFLCKFLLLIKYHGFILSLFYCSMMYLESLRFANGSLTENITSTEIIPVHDAQRKVAPKAIYLIYARRKYKKMICYLVA